MKLTFNIGYFIIFIILFLVEVFIAIYINDKFIRPFVGDMIVVVLIYAFIRIFLDADYKFITLGVFIFSCLVEIGQYFKMVEIFGLGDNQLARIVLGTSFSWLDILSYGVGALFILWWERKK